ncbi:hypothetical protein GCM10011577_07830 [Pseudarthrobacter polychromogenes]|uniref:Uncharacterized protein n=1 Tax=Pseudarthrobacter polychromogenes TaxID=1676 RepID=A0ABQ1XCP9_9MICC|nr:hypothetical protein GCM10011577_07830 [Pseudarthrobacter polychromogenes]
MSVRFCTEILFSLRARSTAPERTDGTNFSGLRHVPVARRQGIPKIVYKLLPTSRGRRVKAVPLLVVRAGQA